MAATKVTELRKITTIDCPGSQTVTYTLVAQSKAYPLLRDGSLHRVDEEARDLYTQLEDAAIAEANNWATNVRCAGDCEKVFALLGTPGPGPSGDPEFTAVGRGRSKVVYCTYRGEVQITVRCQA
jgi:hypothetical protein